MFNPWIHLPHTAPLVLSLDKEILDAFNRRIQTQFAFHFGLYPEPFIGNPGAPIVFLGLNPGLNPNNVATPTNPQLLQAYYDNLNHHNREYPMYLLDPSIGGEGYTWWTRRLRPLLHLFPQQYIAQHIFVVEYFPYHSHKWSYRTPKIPSQAYTFWLVRQAIQRESIIILMRSHALWNAAIPELSQYLHCYRLNSTQNITISRNNCPQGFPVIIKRLEQVL